LFDFNYSWFWKNHVYLFRYSWKNLWL